VPYRKPAIPDASLEPFDDDEARAGRYDFAWLPRAEAVRMRERLGTRDSDS
jgi:hypothetical protein